MENKQVNFTGIFERYTPINMDPYYVFTTEHRYLVRCQDYPELIGELSPSAKINLQGDIGKKLKQGIELVNFRYELLDNE